VQDDIFLGFIWPLAMTDDLEFHILETIWVAQLISKAWKAMTSINVFWLDAQVAKDDIRASAMPLLMVEDALEPIVLTFDVFVHSAEALFDALHSKGHGTTNQPLHNLPLPSFFQVKETHDLFIWM
jgi:hypothetical protein